MTNIDKMQVLVSLSFTMKELELRAWDRSILHSNAAESKLTEIQLKTGFSFGFFWTGFVEKSSDQYLNWILVAELLYYMKGLRDKVKNDIRQSKH